MFILALKEIPNLYSNFVEEQYMSIFAMALPYTDSFKYTAYTVTLAHQVIADWFTRCRLTFRKGFVTLIAKALKCGPYIDCEKESTVDKYLQDFHEEMTEVCLDMMARCSFSAHMTQPRRSPLARFLLDNGVSQTWFVGNMLITVTTSCNSHENCSKCKKNETINTTPIKDNVVIEDNKPTVTGPSERPAETIQMENSKGINIPIVSKSAPEQINVLQAALESLEGTPEEEGKEATPLVAKLTNELVNKSSDTHVFSPSEQFLFSRQASKAFLSDNFDDEDENFEDGESGDEVDANIESYESENFFGDFAYGREDSFHEGKNKMKTNEEDAVFTKSVIPKESSHLVERDHVPEKVALSHCQCACEGWAEVYIRRPTSNFSWMMKIDNSLDRESLSQLADLSALAFDLEGHQLANKIGERYFS